MLPSWTASSPSSASPRSRSWPPRPCPAPSPMQWGWHHRWHRRSAAAADRGAHRAVARARRCQHGAPVDDRTRLLRHPHPWRDPRNVLENPAWYTAYTPHTSRRSARAGSEALNFQTMVADPHRYGGANVDARRGDCRRRGDDPWMLRATKNKSRRLRRSTPILPADPRRHRDARPAARYRSARRRTRSDDRRCRPTPGERLYGVITQVLGASGLVDAAPIIAAAHERDAMIAVGTDFAGGHPDHPTRRARRRCALRDDVAIRGPDGVRRPARRVPVGEVRAHPSAARAPRRWSR